MTIRRNGSITSRDSGRKSAAGSFGALAGLFEDLSAGDNRALRKTLQLYLDPESAKKSDREKENELEAILKG
jgi:hypothetical protein